MLKDQCCIAETDYQSNLARGRIADLSSLAAANGCVRSWPHITHGSFDPHESTPSPQTATPSVHLLLHSSPVCMSTHRHRWRCLWQL